MNPPEKRIPWGKGDWKVKEDIRMLKTWEKGFCTDEVLCGSLRMKYGLDDWTDDQIMENVYWLGYNQKKSDWKGD